MELSAPAPPTESTQRPFGFRLSLLPILRPPVPAPPPTAPESPPLISATISAPREPRTLNEVLLEVHQQAEAVDRADGNVFQTAVDEAFAPGYSIVVKQPMDMSIIANKLANNQYPSPFHYMDDICLMIDNALAYNKRGTYHHKYALKMQAYFSKAFADMFEFSLSSHHYCCSSRRLLSGVSYRCRSATCFITYGSTYWQYTIGEGKDKEEFNFCQLHHHKLPSEIVIPRYLNGTGGEIKFQKSNLKKLRHNTPLENEPFVECEKCHHIDHEICVMHNFYLGQPYLCSQCSQNEQSYQQQRRYSPRDLPRCQLSDILEEEVHNVIGYGENVVVRVVNMTEDACETKPLFRERFPEHASRYPYIRKVILAFMQVDAHFVCFFGMIVHEYDDKCPQPNTRRTYLSLLDSVKLPKNILPSEQRTNVYHALVRGYLYSCSLRGFWYCHIYSCPPRKGQNYIFPFKPDDQKEISMLRLRLWYHRILNDSMIGNHSSVENFMTLDLALPNAKFTEVPYFDGDNWPEIIEDIIKIDEATKNKPVEPSPKIALRERKTAVDYVALDNMLMGQSASQSTTATAAATPTATSMTTPSKASSHDHHYHQKDVKNIQTIKTETDNKYENDSGVFAGRAESHPKPSLSSRPPSVFTFKTDSSGRKKSPERAIKHPKLETEVEGWLSSPITTRRKSSAAMSPPSTPSTPHTPRISQSPTSCVPRGLGSPEIEHEMQPASSPRGLGSPVSEHDESDEHEDGNDRNDQQDQEPPQSAILSRPTTPTQDNNQISIKSETFDPNKPRSSPRFRKPRVSNGHYEGQSPPRLSSLHLQQQQQRKRKKTKAPQKATKSSSKAKTVLTAEMRLNNVIAVTKRDFLVVKLKPSVTGEFIDDPDKAIDLPTTGEDHCVSGLFRQERLEFSSLRHCKYSTMILLYFIFAQNNINNNDGDANNTANNNSDGDNITANSTTTTNTTTNSNNNNNSTRTIPTRYPSQKSLY